MNDIDAVWIKIQSLAGEPFRTKTGKVFSYDCDSSSVQLRNTTRNVGRGQFKEAISRFPVTGPGALQDLQGPSYVYAILTDPRVTDSTTSQHTSVAPLTQHAPVVAQQKHVRSPALMHGQRLGTPVTELELRGLDFTPHELRFHADEVVTTRGIGCEWDTIGEVPSSPGVYAFTAEDPRQTHSLKVVYVGLTTHLWMVTKGALPGGIARGGQRYGRPVHAGETRKRVNVDITAARAGGLAIKHWVKPVESVHEDVRSVLRREEEVLIERWQLRLLGWNKR